MIAAISLMRKRPDITVAQFRRHWIDPHGVMTAELPGLRRYVQHHCISSLATNARAEELGILGFPMLYFDDVESRRIAYTSPRIAECNVDSEHFIGAVKRLATEPREMTRPHAVTTACKVIVLALGRPDHRWDDGMERHAWALPGVVGYVRHRIIEQAAAPNSRIPPLEIEVGGLAEVTFESAAALARSGPLLESGPGPDVAIYAVEEFRLL